MTSQDPESPGVADSREPAARTRAATSGLADDSDALWSARGIVHRMETLSLSFVGRARHLRSVGALERAAEAEHAADMIRMVLTDFTHDYDHRRGAK